MSDDPIRVGDKFVGRSGEVWRVFDSAPCGVRHLINESRTRMYQTTVRQIRLGGMTRVQDPPTPASRSASPQ